MLSYQNGGVYKFAYWNYVEASAAGSNIGGTAQSVTAAVDWFEQTKHCVNKNRCKR